jgi:hypothetical protein
LGGDRLHPLQLDEHHRDAGRGFSRGAVFHNAVPVRLPAPIPTSTSNAHKIFGEL